MSTKNLVYILKSFHLYTFANFDMLFPTVLIVFDYTWVPEFKKTSTSPIIESDLVKFSRIGGQEGNLGFFHILLGETLW